MTDQEIEQVAALVADKVTRLLDDRMKLNTIMVQWVWDQTGNGVYRYSYPVGYDGTLKCDMTLSSTGILMEFKDFNNTLIQEFRFRT